MALPWQQHPAGDCVLAPAAGRTGRPLWRPRQIPLVTPRVGAPVGRTGEEAPAGRRRRGWREGPPSSPRSHYSLQYETPGELSINVLGCVSCVCVCACVRACVRACVCVCVLYMHVCMCVCSLCWWKSIMPGVHNEGKGFK